MIPIAVKNEKLITNYLNTTLHEKDLSIINEVLLESSLNYTAFGTSIGTHKIIADFEVWHGIFSDIKFKIIDKIIFDNSVVYQLTEQAKHVNCFKSIPATGKTIHFDATIAFRADAEKILGYALSTNLESILKQIIDPSKHHLAEIMKKPLSSGASYFFFEKIQHYLHSINMPLTIQQIKCLSLWFDRKTAKEIANILNISYRTIEVHLDSAKLRLGISSKKMVFEFIESHHLQHLLKECARFLTEVC